MVIDIRPKSTLRPVEAHSPRIPPQRPQVPSTSRPVSKGDMDMEVIAILIVLVIGLVAFDGAALRFGADSRPRIADDHAR